MAGVNLILGFWGFAGRVEAGFGNGFFAAVVVADVGLEVDAAGVGFGAGATRGAADTLGGGADLVAGTGFFASGFA